MVKLYSYCRRSSVVEHFHGKEGVSGSSPDDGSSIIMSEIKKLYKDPKNAKIAGVCAGLAEYFELDVSLVRILMLVSIFVSGIGIIFYIIAWLVLPDKVN